MIAKSFLCDIYHISPHKGFKNISDKIHPDSGQRCFQSPVKKEELHSTSGGIASRISGVSADHTYFLSSPSGLKTRSLWVAQTALAKCYFHTHKGAHTPDSSPRETCLLWRQSNQAAVAMTTEVIGPFCICMCPLSFSISSYYKALFIHSNKSWHWSQQTFKNLRRAN